MKKIYEDINIYGDYIASEPVAFCHLYSHRGSLTTSNLKKHKCLSKRCPYLKKNMEHPYWEYRQLKKKESKERRRVLYSVYA